MTAIDTDGFSWAKGHGTENDFVLLPDPDGFVHGAFADERAERFVAALCNRRRGLGADGVIRIVRADVLADQFGDEHARRAVDDGAEWFMDYRNADGSLSQMCGNGARVFARWLLEEGHVSGLTPVPLGTRAGTVLATLEPDELLSVDMGPVRRTRDSEITIGERRWQAIGVDVGNPHAVVDVGDVGDAGALIEPPGHDPASYPSGVNVEFVAGVGERHVRMRVHERGSGETRSCGTGACAAAVLAEQLAGHPARPATYRVDVAGGRLAVTLRDDGHAVLTGPAEVVARGTMVWSGPITP
jgi:diaminopimelate epimerase